jgi:hypothetical protein
MFEALIVVYILNLMLLVLHEIESAYFKEWEILKLPGGITGFLLLHVPILAVFFYGLAAIALASDLGLVIGIVAGAGGLLPLFVHKVLVRRKNAFHLPISIIVMVLNACTGAALIVLCALELAV